MNVTTRIVLGLLALLALFVLAGQVMLWWPDPIYRIERVRVLEVDGAEVTLEMERVAHLPHIPTLAVCQRELVCANIVTLRSVECAIDPNGRSLQRRVFPISAAAFNGDDLEECYYNGVVTLWPLGTLFGPAVAVDWRTEPFMAERPEE